MAQLRHFTTVAQRSVRLLAGGHASRPSPSTRSSSSSSSGPTAGSGDVLHAVRDNAHVITLNKPQKRNAITLNMYDAIIEALERAAKDDSTLTVFTGAGDYYCAGLDLSLFDLSKPEEIPSRLALAVKTVQKSVDTIIDHPKPIVAVVNGPAIGIGVTTLGLFDAVFTTDRSTFQTPFSLTAQSPEGCSSYTFSKIMGQAAACDMLLFNRKLTAAEALQRGLVTEVFPAADFEKLAWARVAELARLPPQSLRAIKGLMREREREVLHEVNKKEGEVILGLWAGAEFMTTMMKLMKKK